MARSERLDLAKFRYSALFFLSLVVSQEKLSPLAVIFLLLIIKTVSPIMRLILFTRDTKCFWAPAQAFLVQQIDYINGHNVLRVTW